MKEADSDSPGPALPPRPPEVPPLCPALQICSLELRGVSSKRTRPRPPSDGKGSPFIAYMYIQRSPSGLASWKVDRRFSALLQLHSDLVSLKSDASIALTKGLRLPSKFTFSKTSKRVVSKRALSLETYLKTLLSRGTRHGGCATSFGAWGRVLHPTL